MTARLADLPKAGARAEGAAPANDFSNPTRPLPLTQEDLDHTQRLTMVDHLAPKSTLDAADAVLPAISETPPSEATSAFLSRCEAELAAHPPAQRAGRLHYEIARLSEYPLRDGRRASNHYQQAYERLPEHLPTIRGLRRTLIARRALKQALPLFDAEARLTSDSRAKAKLMLAKGRLLEDGLALRGEARAAYRTALDLDPSDPAILEANEQSELLSEEWAELSQTYGRQANVLERDPKQRAAFLIRRAQLLESRLDDPEGAIAHYETAFELDASSSDALEALKRLYYTRGRLRDLVRILETEASRTESPAVKASALYQAARIHADRLGNRPDALAALERALEAEPKNRLLIAELAELREASRDFRGLADVLAKQVEQLEPDTDQTSILHRIGNIYLEHLGEPQTAQLWFEHALGLDPCYVPALQALGKLYAAEGKFEALVAMHTAEAAATVEPARRAAAHARVAEIYELRLDQPERAIEQHRRALSSVHVYAPSFKALVRLYAESKRFTELIELYERAIENAESDRAISYLAKIGALYEDQLGDPVQAIHAYRRILERDPRSLMAIHALARATEAAGRYGELVEMLLLEGDLTQERAHKVGLYTRAAEVLDAQLNDLEGGMGLLRKVVSLDPRFVPALTALGRMYYRAGRWEDLLSMYQAELAVLGEDQRGVSLLIKMAELCEQRLGRHAEATELYRRAAQLDPRSLLARQAHARKLREQGKWDDLLEVLLRDARSSTRKEERANSFFRAGEVLEFRLNRLDSALDAYDKALSEEPALRPAREGQLRLRATRSEYSKLVEDLLREAKQASEQHVKSAALMRAGELYRDPLRDLKRAISCFEEVLAVDPGHHGALLALDALYRRTGQWTELAGVLRAQAQHFTDAEARATALRELVRVEQKSEPSSANLRGSYESILTLLPMDSEALLGLEGLAIAAGDEALMADVDQRMAEHTADRSLRAHHLTRLAELSESGDPERAIALYQAALDTEAENLAATRGLSRLSRQGEDPEVLALAAQREADVLHDLEAASDLWVRTALARRKHGMDTRMVARDLERALELSAENKAAAYHLTETLLEIGDAQRLSDLLSRAAANATDKSRAAALWREVSRLCADELGNVAGAISALNRALKHAPDDVTMLSDLALLFVRDDQWNEAAQLWSRVIASGSDPIVLRNAHLELAAIEDERLGNPAAALKHLQNATRVAPEDPLVLERLSDLLSRDQRHAEAMTAAQRVVELARSPAARVDALLHLAKVERRRGDLPGFARALIEAVAIAGPSGGAGAALREAIGQGTSYADYATALKRHIQALRGAVGAPIDVILELSRVQCEELNQAHEGLVTLREGLARHPSSIGLRVEHARQLRRAGALEEAANELRLLLVLDVERAQTWSDLAECFDAMGRPEARARVADALAVLSGREVAEGRVRKNRFDLGRIRPAALAGPVLDELSYDLSPFDVTGELLINLGEGLAKLYPADLDGYGVGARDRLTSRQGHPFRALADRVAEAVGAGEFDLYVHRARGRGIGIELGEIPSLIFPAALLDQSDAHQVFALARLLSLTARGCHPVVKLTPRELEVALAAYVRTAVAGFGRGLTSEDLLEEQGRRIQKGLSRRARKAAEDVAARYVAAPPIDIVRWVDSRERLAIRVAALLCGDLAAAVEGMLRARTEGQRDSSIDLRDEGVRDLLRFWVSEQALRTRVKAGLGA